MSLTDQDDFDCTITDDFIVKGPTPTYVPDSKGIGHALFIRMSRYRHAIAQIDATTGVKDTYDALLTRCVNTAKEMRARGLNRGDVVTICSLNNLNACVPLIAANFLGVQVACLDPSLSESDTVHLMKQVRPRMAFIGPEALDLIVNAFREADLQDTTIVVFGHIPGYVHFDEFCVSRRSGGFLPVEIEDLKETAMIFFSSGTTGLPKGIRLSHYGVLGHAGTLTEMGCVMDFSLPFASFYWISSHLILNNTIFAGGCRIIYPKYNPDTFWSILDRYRVTFTFLAPTHVIGLYKKGRPDGVDTTNLRDFLIGGGPISVSHLQEVREIFPGTNVSIAYGQTELSGCGLMFQPRIRKHVMWMFEKQGSTGKPIIGIECRIVDPETEEPLGPNQPGELRIKTDFQMRGYYNLDSNDAWDKDGWLKSGDIAHYDEDGCFFIVDRIKEMLKFRSFHVPPAIIENVLLTHPSIASAVVVGLPHDEDGDHPLAVVVLKNEAGGDVTPKDIERYVEERVSDRQRLRGGVKIVQKIPVTATGKIKRNDVKSMVLKGVI